MCAVSMVMDYANRYPVPYWTSEKYFELLKFVKQAEEFDQKTNQPHCEDPKKIEILKRIGDRLAKIEEKVGI